jgi:hypothetical protein
VYDPVTAKSGVTAVSDWFGQFTRDATPDGLQLGPTAGFSVTLQPSLNNASAITASGQRLVVVASVANVLYFRIFEADGTRVVDTNETQLPDKAFQVAQLKATLGPLWNVPQLAPADRETVLTLVASVVGYATPFGSVALPEFLRDWLVDLRLLRRVPLCYLVPDARLLPPESIRFFNVDTMWVDRLIDGVFAAGNLGTVDATFSYALLGAVRNALDDRLEQLASELGGAPWRPGRDSMTGCLIRSELVRRWPDLIVTAFFKPGANPALPWIPLAVLRAETLSRDIFIALFAGMPQLVRVTEPHVGARYGVDPPVPVVTAPQFSWRLRDQSGAQVPDHPPLPVPTRKPDGRTIGRTISVKDLLGKVDQAYALGSGARTVALQLSQPPYVQDFSVKIDEAEGSHDPVSYQQAHGPTVPLRGGRVLHLDRFIARLKQTQS